MINRIRINQHIFTNNISMLCTNPCRSLVTDDERIEDTNDRNETRMNFNSNLYTVIKFNLFNIITITVKEI